MTIGLSFGGVCAWIWGYFIRGLEELKITMEELLVALGNIVKACFRWLFERYQNSLLLLLRR
jgi:hypothetical protein